MEDAAFLWHRLAQTRRPVVLYGMGDGADKILALCRRYGVPVAGVFASDGFVRGQVYQGFRVETLAALEARFPEMIVLLCFASQRPEVLEQIRTLSLRHTLLVPDVPVVGDVLITPELLRDRRAEIDEAESLLADQQSRQVLRDVLEYKCTGDPALLWRCETPRDEVFASLLPLGGDEFFVDAGAYTGDTVEEFLLHTGGRYRQILALEPDARNFRKLEATVARLELENVHCLHTGVWSGEAMLHFNHKSGRQAAFEAHGPPDTPVNSLDNLLAGLGPTLIKYDVEGAEEQALLGTAETIRRHRPGLAVAAYHRGDDVFTLPLLLHRLCPGYRLYLRHHPYLPAWETNCYALI